MKEEMPDYLTPETIKNMSPRELDYHYFKLHDFDENLRLDGLELLAALGHVHADDDDDDDDEYYKYKKHKASRWKEPDNVSDGNDFKREENIMRKLEKEDDTLAIAASRRYQEHRSLSCKACGNKYNRKDKCPYILSVCGHTVCWDCIERVSGRRSTECPLCHERNGDHDDRPLNYSVYMLLQEDEDADECYGAKALPTTDAPCYYEYGKIFDDLYDDLTEDDFGRPIGKGDPGESEDEAKIGKWAKSKKHRWQREREEEQMNIAIAMSLSILEDQEHENHDERSEFDGMRREQEGVTREERWGWEGEK
ncbi:uncharacterized protein LOC119571469 [Penaeus monodon]|uniref:uncharacterized protein LOC119571469 n=1 Tax=Penaeus monodon TaxID=6687 RepID=UPI0018A746D5|nr:uncharacterized protein LOC119571469 [Penaeus monodon]XP_037774743.1 uncharacterized protein LOC119571469 [Penaeus monodon]XP_037774777.1 uncharacterized protein LOC119571469 [Penaeus monodon]